MFVQLRFLLKRWVIPSQDPVHAPHEMPDEMSVELKKRGCQRRIRKSPRSHERHHLYCCATVDHQYCIDQTDVGQTLGHYGAILIDHIQLAARYLLVLHKPQQLL